MNNLTKHEAMEYSSSLNFMGISELIFISCAVSDVKQYHRHSSLLTGSWKCGRAKPPLRAVLLINLLGKGLIPRLSMSDSMRLLYIDGLLLMCK